MKCPYCGKEALTSVHTPWGDILYACPCVPPNTAVQVRVDQLILDAVWRDVLAFKCVEHDPGDEDLRPLSDRVCMMCSRSLSDYIPYRERAAGFHGKYVGIALESESTDLEAREDLRVCNHWQCVQQAKDFAEARRVRRFFSAT